MTSQMALRKREEPDAFLAVKRQKAAGNQLQLLTTEWMEKGLAKALLKRKKQSERNKATDINLIGMSFPLLYRVGFIRNLVGSEKFSVQIWDG